MKPEVSPGNGASKAIGLMLRVVVLRVSLVPVVLPMSK
jgi:hypothetical protein